MPFFSLPTTIPNFHIPSIKQISTTHRSRSKYPSAIMGEIIHRRSPNFSCCMSPSCVPVHEEYSRIEATAASAAAADKGHRGRRLRKLLRKIVTEGRNIYRPVKTVTFQYDAVSYSQNFDDGCHRDDEFAPWRRQAFQDLKVGGHSTLYIK